MIVLNVVACFFSILEEGSSIVTSLFTSRFASSALSHSQGCLHYGSIFKRQV